MPHITGDVPAGITGLTLAKGTTGPVVLLVGTGDPNLATQRDAGQRRQPVSANGWNGQHAFPVCENFRNRQRLDKQVTRLAVTSRGTKWTADPACRPTGASSKHASVFSSIQAT